MNVEVKFSKVNSVKTAIKLDDDSGELIAAIQLEVGIHPSDIARLLNLQKNHCPLTCVISSDQAQLDLMIQTVDKNGEICDEDKTKQLASSE